MMTIIKINKNNVIIVFVLWFTGRLMQIRQLANVYILSVLIPGIAVGVRRMHDVGMNGLILLVPIYNIILANHDGVKGDIEYGADPKANV